MVRKIRRRINQVFTMRISVKARNTIRSEFDSLLVFIIDAYTNGQMKTREKR